MNTLHRIYLDQNYEFFFNRNSKELLRNIYLSSDFSTICMSLLMFLTEVLIIFVLLVFYFLLILNLPFKFYYFWYNWIFLCNLF